ncbi:MAG: DUF86 domain-containing protein [Lachnospiraceae bacterium]|nr:DUF86 domain-containing protein [Lachnospiraceae bacterium]
MKYSDEQRVKKYVSIRKNCWTIIEESKITKEQLMQEYSLQWLVTTPLYNIGEQVYYLSAAYKEKYTEIPWAMIAGLRHRLVHDYDGTNWNIIADVVFEELPLLLQQLEEITENK